MTQEEKSLLLKDLCTRVLYKPMIRIDFPPGHGYQVGKMETRNFGIIISHFEDGIIATIKPYLHPLASMTEEEREEYEHLVSVSGSPDGAANLVDWLNKKMFAFRTIDGKDMFELGLAIEAPEGMYD